MRILGIETSCDETAVCLIEAEGNFGNDFKFQVLGNALISQIKVHAPYGGVFPNLAKREHAKNLVPLLEKTLQQSANLCQGVALTKTTGEELRLLLAREPELYERLSEFLLKYARPEIDAIAVTVGPGLEPALWVGINFARALSLVWDIPIVAVNHMEGHIVSALIADTADGRRTDPSPTALRAGYGAGAEERGKNLQLATNYVLRTTNYPLLSLLISGGHTELVLSRKWQDYKIIGATRDDAVGEAFDKVARLLGLPYPGGASLSALAERARIHADKQFSQMNADKHLRKSASSVRQSAIILPRPMLHDDSLDFSFAGLKTAVRRIIESKDLALPRSDLGTPLRSDLESKMEIAKEFEDAVADVLVAKTMKAVDEYGVQTVVVGGGVSANSHIRLRLAEALAKAGLPPPLFPAQDLATDNALMIALAGYFRAVKNPPTGGFADPATIRANGNLRLENKKMVSYPPSNEKR